MEKVLWLGNIRMEKYGLKEILRTPGSVRVSIPHGSRGKSGSAHMDICKNGVCIPESTSQLSSGAKLLSHGSEKCILLSTQYLMMPGYSNMTKARNGEERRE